MSGDIIEKAQQFSALGRNMTTQMTNPFDKKENEVVVPPSAISRLPSFRSPRDLTLGMNKAVLKLRKPGRKTFVPNIPAAQKPKSEKKVVSVKPAIEKSSAANSKKRESKKWRDKQVVIQTTSIFSQGLGSDSKLQSRSGRSYGGGSSEECAFTKPKICFNSSIQVNEEEEERKLKELFRDDFIDDKHENGAGFGPTKLPLVDCRKMLKSEVPSLKSELKSISAEKIKQEPIDSMKSVHKLAAKSEIPLVSGVKEEYPAYNMSQIIDNLQNQLLFIQIPDNLPGFKPLNQSSKTSKESTSSDKNDSDGEFESCSLNCLTEGSIGKLRIHKSNRLTMVIGDHIFDVKMGIETGFYQNVASVDTDVSNDIHIRELGEIQQGVICTPTWETIIENTRTT